MSDSSASSRRTPRVASSLKDSFGETFTITNVRELLKIVLPILAFVVCIPGILLCGFYRYYFRGQKEKNEQKAASLPSLYKQYLAVLNREAKFDEKSKDAFHSETVQNGAISLHTIIGGDFSSKSKGCILFVHGYPENSSIWTKQLIECVDHGYTVCAMDLRGYGMSSCPTAVSLYSSRVLVEDIFAVLNHLKNNKGVKDLTLCGHDWGGILTWNSAFIENHPSYSIVRRLVIMDSPHTGFFLKYLMYRDRLQAIRSWYISLFCTPVIGEACMYLFPDSAIPFMRQESPYTQLETDIAVATISDPTRCTAMLNYYRGMIYDRIHGLTIKAVPIRIPVMQLWGSNDAALGPELATLLPKERWIPHANSQTHVFEASHWLSHDCPDEVNKAILKFISDDQ